MQRLCWFKTRHESGIDLLIQETSPLNQMTRAGDRPAGRHITQARLLSDQLLQQRSSRCVEAPSVFLKTSASRLNDYCVSALCRTARCAETTCRINRFKDSSASELRLKPLLLHLWRRQLAGDESNSWHTCAFSPRFTVKVKILRLVITTSSCRSLLMEGSLDFCDLASEMRQKTCLSL